jgi:hypothetical protein
MSTRGESLLDQCFTRVLFHTWEGVVKWFFFFGSGAVQAHVLFGPRFSDVELVGLHPFKADAAHDFAVRTLSPKVSLTAT